MRILLALNVGVVTFGILQSDLVWILNSQCAFISSLLITLASLKRYKDYVTKRVNTERETVISHDEAEKINDEEKEELIHWKERLVVGAGGITPWRIGGYLFLIGCFFYLTAQHLFSVIPFLVGLTIVPVTTFILAWREGRHNDNNS